jgi:AcrR family transcriptional regulator
MDADAPKFRRRKEARPAEIAQAAMAVFMEKGFAGTRLDDVAARAGVSKGALYLYFETKEDLFRAAVVETVLPNIEPVMAMVAAHPGPFEALAEAILQNFVRVTTTTPIGGMLKVVIGEARNFPEIARVWHDQLAAKAIAALSAAIAAAQARGEVRAGDPRLLALSVIGPMVVSVIWRETFVPVGGQPFDIPALAREQLATIKAGLAPITQS